MQVMSVDNSGHKSAVPSPEPPSLRHSVSYMGCRHCKEGSLVYDYEAAASRCRACGKLD